MLALTTYFNPCESRDTNQIYIPSQQQLLFDLNYLYTGFTPTISPVEVMGLKGMKVYKQA